MSSSKFGYFSTYLPTTSSVPYPFRKVITLPQPHHFRIFVRTWDCSKLGYFNANRFFHSLKSIKGHINKIDLGVENENENLNLHSPHMSLEK